METSETLLNQICPTSSQAWIRHGALLLDVREQDEVDTLAYDVPNILHIPLSEFEERYTEVPLHQEVLVACAAGDRSLRATNYLVHHGYDNRLVVNMKHGITRWVQKGFPTIGDTSLIEKGEAGGKCCGGGSHKKSEPCCS
jgi:rhodanese-related sulfurtransferase